MKKLSLFTVLALLIFACKDKEELTNDYTPIINIENYSLIAENGATMAADTNDWKYSENIPSQVLSLFEINSPSFCDSSLLTYNLAAYPNPVKEVLSISHILKDGGMVRYKLVDEQLNVYFELDSIANSNMAYSFPELEGTGKLLRLYYEVSNGDCSLIGYGDLKFE